MPEPSLEASPDGRGCLRLSGLPEPELRRLRALPQAELARQLPVYPSAVLDAGRAPGQSFAGRYTVTPDAVCFEPSFPFLADTSYTMLVRSGTTVASALTAIPIRAERAPATEVIEIYPTADELPRNQLKLYVWFSGPMSEGQVARHVQLLRADTDEPIEAAFLPGPELWDRERRRLTLLFDPGRVKRGLLPNEDTGYPLTPDLPVRVVVDGAFRDAEDRPLRGSFERRYRVGADVRTRVDPGLWAHQYPSAGSADPLVIRFDRPLDHALLQHSIQVTDASRRPLTGSIEVGAGERSWRFVPQLPWREGRYRLLIEANLEDLAGNSIKQVFDRELALSGHERRAVDVLEVPLRL